MTTVTRLRPGTIIGKDYKVIRLLAKGGMGAVYIAEQMSTASERALKVMHAQLLDDARSRERFTQEARICARIESDHVVKVIGAGIDDELGTPWIAMELIKGSDLDAVMKDRGVIPPAEVLEIFRQLCHGLGAAHRIGVIHRDLKPANVLIAASQRSDSPFTVKVLDFGISKVLQESQSDTTAAMGSPLWMAPEQAQKGKLTPATDLWPLGLIAFRMLSGKPFWKAANGAHAAIREVLTELLVAPIPEASARSAEVGGAELPRGFDAWFAHCLVRAPGARFNSAEEAIAALIPALSDAPAVVAPPPVLPVPAAPVLTAEPAESTTGAVTIPRAPPVVPTKRSLPRGWVVAGTAAVVIAVVLALSHRTSGRRSNVVSVASMRADQVAPPVVHPVAPPLGEVVGLASGGDALTGTRTCAWRTDGTVWCWGVGANGVPDTVAVQIPSLAGVEKVAVGNGHACALLRNHTVWCWGHNEHGELGDGTTAIRPAPVPVRRLVPANDIVAGDHFTCARDVDLRQWCWGDTAQGSHAIPMQTTDVQALAPGGAPRCALHTDGTVWCGGADGGTAVPGLANAASIAVGDRSACARIDDGTVRCWGANAHGELGDGTTIDRNAAVAVRAGR